MCTAELIFDSLGSDSENSDGTPWRGSGGSVNMARRSLASGSRPSTPIMSPIMNRSSSGSRLGAMHLTSRSGSGSGLFPPRTIVRRTDSANETDQRRKRLRRRTMIYGTLTFLVFFEATALRFES
nr:unnamed protein product [Haemonchus contortus]